MTWIGVANSGEILFATDDNALIDYGELRGDVSGILGAVQVQALRGVNVENKVPVSGEVLQHDGTQWAVRPLSALDLDDHQILSGRHTDTNPDAIVRGDILYASGATPLWARLPLGTAEFVLYSDGTDATYTRLGPNTPFELGTAGAPSMTFTGDLDTGLSSAADDVLVASASGAAVLTVENAADGDLVTIDAGQVLRTRTVAGGAQAMTNDDYILLVTAAGGTVSLPGGPRTGQVVIIKDRDGNASGGTPITISGNGNNIDGNASISLRRAYGSFTLLYNGTEWNII